MFRTVDHVYYKATTAAWPGFIHGDDFAVRWSGFLIIRKKGRYRFTIVSNDGSKLYIDNKLIVNNDGLHSMRSRESSYRCRRGQHYLRLEMFEKSGRAGMVFMYKGRDTHNELKTVTSKALKHVSAHGFKEEVFYTGANTKVPAVMNNAAMERVVPHVVYAKTKGNWPGFQRADNFACRWTGFLEIKRGGRYRFSIISDDGSILYVNKQKAVDNDGLHSLRNQEGIITLKSKQKWSIRLEYFESKGNAGMVLRYMGFDTDNKMKYIPRRVVTVEH